MPKKKPPAADVAADAPPADASDEGTSAAKKKPKRARVWDYIKKNDLQDKSKRG